MFKFSKKTELQYLWKGLSYFAYLLHVVSHLCKLQSYYVIIAGYRPACSKFSKATNQQYLWKGSIDFVDILQVVIWILLDIHWSHKNMIFWAGIVRHRLSSNQIDKCFKLKKLTKDMRYQDDLFLPLKLEEILC